MSTHSLVANLPPCQQESGVDSSTDTEDRYHPPDRRAAAGSNDGSQLGTTRQRQGLPAATRAASKTSTRRGGGGGGSAKRRPHKVLHCREAELLPAVYARLDSADWRERMKGLEEVCRRVDFAVSLLARSGGETRSVHCAPRAKLSRHLT